MLDWRVRTIVYAIEGYVQSHYGIGVTITEVCRSEQENKELYERKGIKLASTSVHSFWRAVDIRSWDFEPEQLREICQFINRSFEYTGERKTAIVHKVGDGAFHFHIQVDVDGETILSRDKREWN